MENVPAGSRLAEEWYTAPSIGGPQLDVYTTQYLGRRSLDEYRQEGYQYLVVSSYIYDRHFTEPERFPETVAFYRELFAEANLLQRFVPSSTRGGTEIRIYGLDSAETTTLSGVEPPD